MNFLAHLKLSGDHEKIMLGNFIADHIRGNKIQDFPKEVVDGIMLHRKIDYYTDHHPAFIQTRARLHKKYHKYAGVIADIFYDHFLARHWDEYSEISLSHFTSFSYGVLLRNYIILPKKTKQLLPFIIMQNWLASYAKFDGLQRSFDMMARRAKYKSNMEHVIGDLHADYELYKEEFERFFPDIANFCERELSLLFKGEEWESKNRIIKTAKVELIMEEREKERIQKEKKDERKKAKKLKSKNSVKKAKKVAAPKEKKKKTPVQKKESAETLSEKKIIKKKASKKSTNSSFSRIKDINSFTDKSLESLKEVSKGYVKRMRTSKYKK